MLNPKDAVEQVRQMIEWRDKEKPRLDRIRSYMKGTNPDVWLSSGVPEEVRRLAQIAKVPVIRLVVESVVQSLYVDGYRAPRADGDVPAWEVWQRNRMDKRQMGVHRAASSYGASYSTVLPGEPVPVLRGVSPRNMTTVYGEDDDWPVWALEKRRTAKGKMWRLYDETHSYWVGDESDNDYVQDLRFLSDEAHDAGVTPVVRFLDTEDLDDEVTGEVEPLIPLQDQINITTFGLLVAQHYGAFRQRYIIGWLAETEEQRLKAAASELWTFEDGPEDIKIGEFEQTDLKGYLDSREATLRHLAMVGQTPVNELTGMLINLSAEALVAARDAHNRKIDERKTVRGESWEQALDLSGQYMGLDLPPDAWVRWKDTDARALSATADGLGKFAEMLGIPKEALWERAAEAIGAPQQELETWKAMAAEGSALDRLTDLFERQGNGEN